MDRTRMETSNRASELLKRAKKDVQYQDYLRENASSLRAIYPSFKLTSEGGHPRKWHLLHHWFDIVRYESVRACMGCGRVEDVIRDDPNHSHEELLGYIDPDSEDIKEPIDYKTYQSLSKQKTEVTKP